MFICSLIFSSRVSALRNNCDWLENFNIHNGYCKKKKTLYTFWLFPFFSVSLSPSPPYPSGTFDRILLDAPCSALGQRPQFVVRMNLKELQSYPRLQRKLFTTVSVKNRSCHLSECRITFIKYIVIR